MVHDGEKTIAVGYEKCPCGKCDTYFLTGIGRFVQGSGFTLDEAKRIAESLNGKKSDCAKPVPIEKIAIVIAHSAMLNARIAGMVAENDIRKTQGYSMAFSQGEFENVIREYTDTLDNVRSFLEAK